MTQEGTQKTIDAADMRDPEVVRALRELARRLETMPVTYAVEGVLLTGYANQTRALADQLAPPEGETA